MATNYMIFCKSESEKFWHPINTVHDQRVSKYSNANTFELLDIAMKEMERLRLLKPGFAYQIRKSKGKDKELRYVRFKY